MKFKLNHNQVILDDKKFCDLPEDPITFAQFSDTQGNYLPVALATTFNHIIAVYLDADDQLVSKILMTITQDSAKTANFMLTVAIKDLFQNLASYRSSNEQY